MKEIKFNQKLSMKNWNFNNFLEWLCTFGKSVHKNIVIVKIVIIYSYIEGKFFERIQIFPKKFRLKKIKLQWNSALKSMQSVNSVKDVKSLNFVQSVISEKCAKSVKLDKYVQSVKSLKCWNLFNLKNLWNL